MDNITLMEIYSSETSTNITFSDNISNITIIGQSNITINSTTDSTTNTTSTNTTYTTYTINRTNTTDPADTDFNMTAENTTTTILSPE